tara:strand:- start:951 stop:1325 length:375 start_codon:yes stop_codon:yes gene_type:complete
MRNKEINKVNLKSKFDLINNFWSPKIVGELNGQHVKIAKFKGEFIMHNHQDEDELFLVINGTLYIELKSKVLELKSGEFIIIPRGVDHKPYSKNEVSVLLFEPKSTLNTGNVYNEFTISNIKNI